MTTKTLLCPQCEDEQLVEKITDPIQINVNGKIVSVQADLFRCTVCGEEIEDPENSQDELEMAYKKITLSKE